MTAWRVVFMADISCVLHRGEVYSQWGQVELTEGDWTHRALRRISTNIIVDQHILLIDKAGNGTRVPTIHMDIPDLDRRPSVPCRYMQTYADQGLMAYTAYIASLVLQDPE